MATRSPLRVPHSEFRPAALDRSSQSTGRPSPMSAGRTAFCRTYFYIYIYVCKHIYTALVGPLGPLWGRAMMGPWFRMLRDKDNSTVPNPLCPRGFPTAWKMSEEQKESSWMQVVSAQGQKAPLLKVHS